MIEADNSRRRETPDPATEVKIIGEERGEGAADHFRR